MAKNLRSNVYEGGLTVDPTAGAGVSAAVGSILPRRGTRELWQKFGAGNTQWQLFPQNGSVLTWGNGDIAAGADTRFLSPGRQQGAASTLDIQSMPMPRAGTLRNLFVRHHASVGDGDNVVYTILINGAPTTITVTLASNVVATASDQVNTAAVVLGDLVSLQAVKALNITNGNLQVQATLELL